MQDLSSLDHWFLLWCSVNYKPSSWSIPSINKSPSDYSSWFILSCKWPFLFLLRSLLCFLASSPSQNPHEAKRKASKSYWPLIGYFFIVSSGILGGVLQYNVDRDWNVWFKWSLGILWLFTTLKLLASLSVCNWQFYWFSSFCFLSSLATRDDVWQYRKKEHRKENQLEPIWLRFKFPHWVGSSVG